MCPFAKATHFGVTLFLTTTAISALISSSTTLATGPKSCLNRAATWPLVRTRTSSLHEPYSKPGTKMVDPEPCKELSYRVLIVTHIIVIACKLNLAILPAARHRWREWMNSRQASSSSFPLPEKRQATPFLEALNIQNSHCQYSCCTRPLQLFASAALVFDLGLDLPAPEEPLRKACGPASTAEHVLCLKLDDDLLHRLEANQVQRKRGAHSMPAPRRVDFAELLASTMAAGVVSVDARSCRLRDLSRPG